MSRAPLVKSHEGVAGSNREVVAPEDAQRLPIPAIDSGLAACFTEKTSTVGEWRSAAATDSVLWTPRLPRCAHRSRAAHSGSCPGDRVRRGFLVRHRERELHRP